jgi:hypothetical protein
MAGVPPGKYFAARAVPLRLTRRALSGREGYVARGIFTCCIQVIVVVLPQGVGVVGSDTKGNQITVVKVEWHVVSRQKNDWKAENSYAP